MKNKEKQEGINESVPFHYPNPFSTPIDLLGSSSVIRTIVNGGGGCHLSQRLPQRGGDGEVALVDALVLEVAQGGGVPASAAVHARADHRVTGRAQVLLV